MSSIDPYSPPKAPVVRAEEKPPLGLKEYAVIGLVVLQVVLAIRFAVTVSSFPLNELSSLQAVVFFAATALCVGVLVLGGVLTVRKGRSPTYIFALAAVLSFGLMMLWHLGFSTVCAILSLCTAVLSAMRIGGDDHGDLPPA
jgi:hypothetical protein